MAEIKDVRLEESLRVRVGEAKDLPAPSSISGSCRSTCCAIRIDSEEIFRTSTVDKSLNPLYSAEFSGEIPRKFRHLSFYVFDVGGKKHKVVGKVLLKKEELYKYNQKEHWFPLQGQDGVAEVEGKVHLEVRLEECLSQDSFASKHMMAVRVVECSDLKVINGSCNPYAVVSLCSGRSSKNKECKRTAVRKKTICPHFDETFFFSLDGKTANHSGSVYSVEDVCAGELSISLFHDDSKVSREVLGNKFKGHFLGEVKISLSHIDFTFPHKAWYCLQAKESHKNGGAQELGSLRLCINYTADYVFPAKYYEELRLLILKSVDSSIPITSTVVFLLGEIANNRQMASQALVRLFLNHGKLVPLIHALSDWEMSSCLDPNTLFRGNSLLTKIVDELMKLVGLPYLHDTLKAIIHQICCDPKPCEIDPSRLKDGEDLEVNLENLHSLVADVLSSIVGSGLVCPLVMRDVFSTLKSRAIRNYPENSAVRYHAVTSFVFLRFFSAAILGPKLFDLYTEAVDASVQRTLTLISKTIAGLVNLVSSKGATVTVKEEYMVPLFNIFPASTQMEIKMFLDIISSSSGTHFKNIEAPIILKEGTMIKRAQGRKKFGRKNFKRRHFVLTNQSLSYSTKAGGKVLFEMPINDILAVEKLEEESFKMKYMFQVVQAERTLYIQASHCVEEKEWIDILTKICKSNANRRKTYHPAAFVNGHWLCCKSTDHVMQGCKLVSGYFPPSELQLDIDSDREVEKIHSLFLDKMDRLDDIKVELGIEMDGIFYEDEAGNGMVEEDTSEMCGTQAVYAGGCDGGESGLRNMGSGFKAMCSDPASCFVTISEIQKAVITLEHEHIQYMRSVHKNAVIGSLDTPIGDGSSADLLRNLNRSSERLSRHGSRSSNASNMSRRSNRICHSRGNSFRDRSRSGTDSDHVKKSLSGDVSVSTRSLAVEFKLDRRKAASYDTFASVERRRSHGTMEFSRVGRFAVDSSGHLLSYEVPGDHMDGRWYGNNVSRDSVLECDGTTEDEGGGGGGGGLNQRGENDKVGASDSGSANIGQSGSYSSGGGGGGASSRTVSRDAMSPNHSRVSAHSSWPCSRQATPRQTPLLSGGVKDRDSEGHHRGNNIFAFKRRSSGVDTVSSSASASTRFSGSSWMETCIDDDFIDNDDDNNSTLTPPGQAATPRPLIPSQLYLDPLGVSLLPNITSNGISSNRNENGNHCSNNIIVRSPTPTENIDTNGISQSRLLDPEERGDEFLFWQRGPCSSSMSNSSLNQNDQMLLESHQEKTDSLEAVDGEDGEVRDLANGRRKDEQCTLSTVGKAQGGLCVACCHGNDLSRHNNGDNCVWRGDSEMLDGVGDSVNTLIESGCRNCGCICRQALLLGDPIEGDRRLGILTPLNNRDSMSSGLENEIRICNSKSAVLQEEVGFAGVATTTTNNNVCLNNILETGRSLDDDGDDDDGGGDRDCVCEGGVCGGGPGSKVQIGTNGIGSKSQRSLNSCSCSGGRGRSSKGSSKGAGGNNGGGGGGNNEACEGSTTVSVSNPHCPIQAHQNQTCESLPSSLLPLSSSVYRIVPSSSSLLSPSSLLSSSSSSSTSSLRAESGHPADLSAGIVGIPSGSDSSESSIDVGLSDTDIDRLEIML